SNLLIDADGVVKILDLGLARFLDHRADDLTERLGGGMPLGAPDYVAPEQALPTPDERSDIYSPGATLYALLLGEPSLHEARSPRSKPAAHQVQPVAPPHRRDPSVPAELSLAVLRMLAKKPADRFQNIDQVIAALSPWQARLQNCPPAPPEPTTPSARPW